MEAANYSIYVLFSIVNFFGCAFAIYKMYCFFKPDMQPPKFFRATVHGWIVCLLIFAVQQTNTIVLGDLGIVWSLKLGVFIFAWFSLNFARIANYIKDSTEA